MFSPILKGGPVGHFGSKIALPTELNRVQMLRPLAPFDSDARVSVIIPCYNYARYLPDAVHSALSQDGLTVDVIVVDDASTDASLEVARGLAAGDERVRILAHRKNAGPVTTFNDGLAEAEGEFVVRLDADDMLTPGSLRRSVSVAQHFPSVGLVYGHPLHFTGVRPQLVRTRPTKWTIWPGRQWLADRCLDGYNVITSPEVLMRKSILDNIGGQKPLAHTHDMELWLRISAFSDVAYIHGADQAWHREHVESLSARKVDFLTDLVERREAFHTLFAGKAKILPESAYLLNLSMRAIARQALNEAVHAYGKRTADVQHLKRYLEIATSAVETIDALPDWHRTQKWLAMNPILVASHPLFFLRRAHYKLRRWAAWRRWHRSGVF